MCCLLWRPGYVCHLRMVHLQIVAGESGIQIWSKAANVSNKLAVGSRQEVVFQMGLF